MKKFITTCLLMTVLLCMPYSHITTSAAGNIWTSGSASTKQLSGTYNGWTDVSYSKDTDTLINYGENINLVKGAKFEFALVTGKFKSSNGVRNSNTNIIKFTFSSGSNAIEIIFRSLYENTAANLNKIQADISYTKSGVSTLEECFEINRNVINTRHSISIKKESGHYFIIVDGISSIPLSKYGSLDFSNTAVKMSIRTNADSPAIRISPALSSPDSVILGDWSTFGATTITTNSDLTTRYKLDDKISDLYTVDGASRVRETLINHTGYSVNSPIVIEASVSVVNAPAVWWSVGLSRKPYDYLNRRTYDNKGLVSNDFGSKIIDYCGIMFQSVTGKTQAAQKDIQGELKDFVTNASITGYAGRKDLDTFIFEIGNTSTTLKFNEVVLYTTLKVKKSDFPDGKAYPFFHFIETPASPTKYNEISVKGINAPKVMQSSVKYAQGSNTDLVMDFDNRNNGNLVVFKDSALKTVVASKYSSGKLTLDKTLFTSAPLGDMKFYAKNNGGIEEVVVSVFDPKMVMQPPVVAYDTSYWLQGKGDKNFKIDVDVKNGAFSKLIGAGITSTKYSILQKSGTIYTISIDKDWLNVKETGDLKFTVETLNNQNNTEKRTDIFYIKVVYELPDKIESSANSGFNEETSELSGSESQSDTSNQSIDSESYDNSLVSTASSSSQKSNPKQTMDYTWIIIIIVIGAVAAIAFFAVRAVRKAGKK